MFYFNKEQSMIANYNNVKLKLNGRFYLLQAKNLKSSRGIQSVEIYHWFVYSQKKLRLRLRISLSQSLSHAHFIWVKW